MELTYNYLPVCQAADYARFICLQLSFFGHMESTRQTCKLVHNHSPVFYRLAYGSFIGKSSWLYGDWMPNVRQKGSGIYCSCLL